MHNKYIPIHIGFIINSSHSNSHSESLRTYSTALQHSVDIRNIINLMHNLLFTANTASYKALYAL